MRKSVLAIVCALFIFVLSFSSNLPVAESNDFMLQISDPKDAYRAMEIDIKSIYARTDTDNIYFIFDSLVIGIWRKIIIVPSESFSVHALAIPSEMQII